MTQKPISRDKIERQKFKDGLNSKIELALSPLVETTQPIKSIEERQIREAQQRLEIQDKIELESQQIALQEAKKNERRLALQRQQSKDPDPKPLVARMAKEERIAIRADLLYQLERDSKADVERLEAMRLKSKAIIEGK